MGEQTTRGHAAAPGNLAQNLRSLAQPAALRGLGDAFTMQPTSLSQGKTGMEWEVPKKEKVPENALPLASHFSKLQADWPLYKAASPGLFCP